NNFTTDVVQWNGSGSGNWVGQDFGAGNEKDIVEVRIRPNKDAANRTFAVFLIQYSDDGTNYTTAWLGNNSSWSIGTSVTFSLPTGSAFRYWRTRCQSTLNNAFSIARLQMMATLAGADQCTRRTANSHLNANAPA